MEKRLSARNRVTHIKIRIEEGELILPPVVHVNRGHRVAWACECDAFVVQFAGISPLASAEFRSSDKPLNVRKDAPAGLYEYGVAVYANGRIYLDAACPAIII